MGDNSEAQGPVGRWGAARIATALLVVALLVACGFLGYLVWQGQRDDQHRHTAR